MEKGIKGVPKVRQAFARTYFDELHEKVKDSKRLPTWIGELYFEFHRGTYTSMARNKRGNRKSEYAMMELELLSVLAEKRRKSISDRRTEPHVGDDPDKSVPRYSAGLLDP